MKSWKIDLLFKLQPREGEKFFLNTKCYGFEQLKNQIFLKNLVLRILRVPYPEFQRFELGLLDLIIQPWKFSGQREKEGTKIFGKITFEM